MESPIDIKREIKYEYKKPAGPLVIDPFYKATRDLDKLKEMELRRQRYKEQASFIDQEMLSEEIEKDLKRKQELIATESFIRS